MASNERTNVNPYKCQGPNKRHYSDVCFRNYVVEPKELRIKQFCPECGWFERQWGYEDKPLPPGFTREGVKEALRRKA